MSEHAESSPSKIETQSAEQAIAGADTICGENSTGGEGGSVDAELIRRRLRTRMFGAADTGVRVDRFVLLEQIGSGGMGRVYAAWDEQLTRRVALKLLHRHDDTARGRVLREAQAQARVAHPNVVPIHEVGVDAGRLWLAMEYIEGRTLGQWIKREAPSWRELLVVLVQAGRGLEAAHEAGLVHRDFKPSNVMIGADGRARVLDFGLARGLGESELGGSGPDTIAEAWTALLNGTGSGSGSSSGSSSGTGSSTRPGVGSGLSSGSGLGSGSGSGSGRGVLDRSLTVRGSLLGTPAYMAPEQYEGERADPRSDQFSYCVAAYECLFGHRPFKAETLVELSGKICAGEWQPVPRDTTIPKAVVAAVLRGLSPERDERWPSLAQLLAVFEAALAPSRARVFVAGAVAVAAVASLLGVVVVQDQAGPSCALESTALGESWTEARRAQLELGPAGIERLDGWTAQWLESARSSCVATRETGLQSPELFERRGACLERQRRDFGVIVDSLHAGDARLVAQSAKLLEQLPHPDDCAADRLDSGADLPEDPQARAEILDAYAQLRVARIAMETHELERAREIARELGASSASAYLPFALELELLLADFELQSEQMPAYIERLSHAIDRAVDGELELSEARLRVAFAAGVAGRWRSGAEELAISEALRGLSRIHDQDSPRWPALAFAEARVAEQGGRYTEASAHYERARALALGLGLDARVVSAEIGIGNVATLREDFDAAQRAYARAEVVAERWGPAGPLTELIAFNRGLLELERGESEAGVRELERARELRSTLWGERSLPVARADFALAKAAMLSGDYVRGRALCSAAEPIFIEELGPDNELVGQLLVAKGVFAFFAGEYERSLDSYARALANQLKVYGDHHIDVALTHSNIGESLLALGRGDEAELAFTRALELYASLPEVDHDHADLVFALKGQGLARLARGAPELAHAPLERALKIHEAKRRDPVELALTRLALAEALAQPDAPRARELAQLALADFERLELPEQAARAKQWLSQLR